VPSPGLFGCLTRIVGEQIVPDGIEMPQRGMAPVLQRIFPPNLKCEKPVKELNLLHKSF